MTMLDEIEAYEKEQECRRNAQKEMNLAIDEGPKHDNADLREWIQDIWCEDSLCEVWTGEKWTDGRIVSTTTDEDDIQWMGVEYVKEDDEEKVLLKQVRRDDDKAVKPLSDAMKIYKWAYNVIKENANEV